MTRAIAFLRRDWQIQLSYRFAFVLQFFGTLFNLLIFYFLSLLVGDSAAPYLENYNGDYFSFVLIGLAFSGYFGVGLNSFARTIREAQTTGTLEAMLLTPTRLSTIILSSSIYDYGFVTFQVFVYLALGALLFDVNLSTGNIPGALVILLLTIITMTAIGIIAASFIMVLKRGDPVTVLFNGISLLLGGVYYPIALMPEWLQTLSRLLPITYSLAAMRLALLNDASFSELMPFIFALSIFGIILVPASLLIFRQAVHRAKVDGSLAHY
ncbi:MAG: ABC transporter permease [Chloroflexota bacterium]|nr:ABC transporter permease [Chloroflexota bacterium]